MRDRKRSIDIRLIAAKAAAPYVHPALKSVEHTGVEGGPAIVVKIVD